MVRSLGAIAFGLLVTTAAHGEQPVGEESKKAAQPGPSCAATVSAPTPSSEAEERAFAAELETFARRKAFTERLVAQRNAELFEQAITRQARVAKLKRELAEREKTQSERELEDAIALYLKKRELARELAAASARDRASAPSSAPASSSAP
ncbi:MAG: hypothetical protein EOO73_11865 [Myxococcales bacterium]|nr:MAG: hypothetical protein EOO73_11865 [Myxococcales bacterium]